MSVTITEERLKYLEALEARIPELLEIRDKYKKLLESSASASTTPEDTTPRILVAGRSLGYRQRGYITRSTLRHSRPLYYNTTSAPSSTPTTTEPKPALKPYFGQGKPQHQYYGRRLTFRRIPVRINRT